MSSEAGPRKPLPARVGHRQGRVRLPSAPLGPSGCTGVGGVQLGPSGRRSSGVDLGAGVSRQEALVSLAPVAR